MALGTAPLLAGSPVAQPVGASSSGVHEGTRGDDTLTGSGGDDVIIGKAGDDRLRGLGGNDTLVGGAGRDRLTGGSGHDTLVAGLIVGDQAGRAIIEGKNLCPRWTEHDVSDPGITL